MIRWLNSIYWPPVLFATAILAFFGFLMSYSYRDMKSSTATGPCPTHGGVLFDKSDTHRIFCNDGTVIVIK